MKKMSTIAKIIRDLRFVSSVSPGVLTFFIIDGLLEGLAPFVSIYASSLIINGITDGMPLTVLLTYMLASIVLTFAIETARHFINEVCRLRWNQLQRKLDLKIATKMSEIDYSSMEDPDTHRLLRSLWEVENLESGFRRIRNVFRPTIKGLSSMILSAAMMWRAFIGGHYGDGVLGFICSPLCAALVMGCIVASVLINIWASKGVLNASRVYLNKSRAFTNHLLYYTDNYIQGYTAGKDIRIYGQRKLIYDRISSLVRRKNKDNDWCENQSIAYQGTSVLVSGVLNLIVYVYVAIKSLAGLFAVGNIVRYVGGIVQFTTGLGGFLDGFIQLKANTQFMEVYYEFFNLPNALHTGHMHAPNADEPFEIEFRNVFFAYPGTDKYVLKNFSCKLLPNKRFAIVGMNGSGKTTMIKLLCRLYDPQEGHIFLNGKDIREYDYDEYLALFSVVFQDFRLFPFSLGQNVAAGMEYDAAKVQVALEKVGFGERLRTMDKGCETILYKNFTNAGVEISGGEAQKIAIARAVYKDAPIVVLDEPTAALDPLAEQEVYTKFDSISTGKTTVYISHRLSSCKFCDEILVLHNGQLVQQGNHNTLVNQRDGKYYELWNAQASHYMA